MSVQLYTRLRKTTHQDQNYWYFSHLLAFFENINQEHNLLPDCMPLDSLLIYCYHVVKIYIRLLSLCCYCYWQQYFIQINVKGKVNENFLFKNSVSLSLVEGNTLAHKLRVITAVKLQLNATYSQHLELKSVYEKRQYIMGGKLFSSKKMFEQ